ncbi:hypothetical protein CAI16_19740 [Virgibacillus dokdonensis]|uniref:RNA polymerase sigma-70 region 4 domain-containing protein n=1 Tax=Virgibacillus dokdonensis TaxID=302167 RepID=A0A3E0WGG5_9BACI|nr:sigma factor-like helix-turn-helix DNA-binding protein [Virgibacillus dokdonensis]RFA31828.1 hypothetical protein CAI16_19740 [Virgibacillus dokdonensis]
MTEQTKIEKEKIDSFLKEHKVIYKNKLLKNFLSIDSNYKLLEKSILYPNDKYTDELDQAFKKYYLRLKKIKYISKLIYFYSIDFDKKVKKSHEYFPLILDQNIENDESTNITFVDLIKSTENSPNNHVYGSSLKDYIENKKLYTALDKLTNKQLLILESIYLYNQSLKEIANDQYTTIQNISKQHKKALKKLKDSILIEEKRKGEINRSE